MDLTIIRLNDTLSLHIKYWLVLLIIPISFELSASQQQPLESPHLERTAQDSLIIERFNGKREFVVKEGRLIKVWVGERVERGTFLGRKGDTLSIKTISVNTNEGLIIKYNITDISKIKIFGIVIRNLVGLALKIWGGAVAVAGIVAPFALGGAGGLIITFPALIVGGGIYLIGAFISGTRKFDLEKNWKIKK